MVHCENCLYYHCPDVLEQRKECWATLRNEAVEGDVIHKPWSRRIGQANPRERNREGNCGYFQMRTPLNVFTRLKMRIDSEIGYGSDRKVGLLIFRVLGAVIAMIVLFVVGSTAYFVINGVLTGAPLSEILGRLIAFWLES